MQSFKAVANLDHRKVALVAQVQLTKSTEQTVQITLPKETFQTKLTAQVLTLVFIVQVIILPIKH